MKRPRWTMDKEHPERHWHYQQYDAESATPSFPSFMNDGYAPPDWDLIASIEASENAPPQDDLPLS